MFTKKMYQIDVGFKHNLYKVGQLTHVGKVFKNESSV